MARFDLSDTEWSIIAPLLPNKSRGVSQVDDRRVLNGIFWVLRAGATCRRLPTLTTVYNRFKRQAEAGVWVRLFETLAAQSPQSRSSSTARS